MKLKIYKRGLRNFTIQMIETIPPKYRKTWFGLRKTLTEFSQVKSTFIEITDNDLDSIEVDIIGGTSEICLWKEGDFINKVTWREFAHGDAVVEIGQEYEIGDAVRVAGYYQKCIVVERINPCSYYVRFDDGSKFFDVSRHMMSDWGDQSGSLTGTMITTNPPSFGVTPLWLPNIATGEQLCCGQTSMSRVSGYENVAAGSPLDGQTDTEITKL